MKFKSNLKEDICLKEVQVLQKPHSHEVEANKYILFELLLLDVVHDEDHTACLASKI